MEEKETVLDMPKACASFIVKVVHDGRTRAVAEALKVHT